MYTSTQSFFEFRNGQFRLYQETCNVTYQLKQRLSGIQRIEGFFPKTKPCKLVQQTRNDLCKHGRILLIIGTYKLGVGGGGEGERYMLLSLTVFIPC